MLECHLEKNKAQCACTYEPCDRKGRCCKCITYHWRMKQLPGCFFSGRRTVLRSFNPLFHRREQVKRWKLSLGEFISNPN